MWIALLGPLEVRIGDRRPEVAGARLTALLCRLAVEPGRRVSTGELVAAVWPGEPPADPTNALQSLVSRLRRGLGDPAAIGQESGGYRLRAGNDEVDATVFTDRAERGHALADRDPGAALTELTAALALWRGEPLVDGGDGDYVAGYLTRWGDRRLKAVKDRAEILLAQDRPGDVVEELEAHVEAHPLDEPLTALLLRALAAAGRTPEALVRFEQVRARLADELGTDPGPELRRLHLALVRGELAPVAVAAAPTRARRSNLRSALTSFIGREAELDQISAAVGQHRLTTIVGPGGAGKTRLATEVAARWLTVGADTAWLVELAPVTDADNVPTAILGALGFRDARIAERNDRPAPDALDRVLDILRDSRCLLVIDNCEHLIDRAAAVIDRILAESPGVRVLATSREPLTIPGEAVQAIPPLRLPPPTADPEHAAGYAAVQLWLDRARSVRGDFALDPSTVGSVVQIVRRLDGLPLAIELAAARLRVLPLGEIERRLSDRFRLLTGGNRVAVPRHRTLRAVVEWSWDLLADDERLLVERLAVFPAGADTTTATAICTDDELPAEAIDGLLLSLVDKSLLQSFTDPTGVLRFRMLETIREFGVERLAGRDELAAARSAHAGYFYQLVLELEPVLRSADQLAAMATLDLERENVLAALRFLGDTGRGPDALRLCLALIWYWSLLNSSSEPLTWLSFVLEVNAEAAPADLVFARAALALAQVTAEMSTPPADSGADSYPPMDWTGAREQMGILAEPLTEAPPPPFPGIAVLLPMVARFSGRVELAETLMATALTTPDPWLHAALQATVANYADNNGDVELMRTSVETAYQEFRVIGDRWGLASALLVRGRLRTLDGDLPAAIADYEEAVRHVESLGSVEDDIYVRIRLADLRARTGDVAGARQEIRRMNLEGLGGPDGERMVFAGVALAMVELQCGDVAEALDHARALRERLTTSPPSSALSGHAAAIVLGVAGTAEAVGGDLTEAEHSIRGAYAAGVSTHDMPILATVGLAVSTLALRLERPADAAVVLGASAQIRGSDDHTDLTVIRLTKQLRSVLGPEFTTRYAEGRSLSREEAIAQLDPGALTAPAEG